MNRRLIFFCLALLLGCGREQASASKTTVRFYQDLPDDAVLVQAGLERLTKRDFERDTQFLESLFTNRQRQKRTEAQQIKFQDKIRKLVVDSFVARACFKSICGKGCGDVDTAAIRREKEADFTRSFAKRGQSFRSLRRVFEKKGMMGLFDSYFENEVKMEAFLQRNFKDQLETPETEVTNIVRWVAETNRRAALTNALNFAAATNVWNRLKAGEDFAKLADAYSMDPEKNAGGDMEVCVENDLQAEGKDYCQRVLALKDGEFSEVLPTETGIEIVKMVKRLTKEESGLDEPSYHLARIFFRRAYLFPEETVDEARKTFAKESRRELLQRLLKESAKTVKISFPCGRDVISFADKKQDKKQGGKR